MAWSPGARRITTQFVLFFLVCLTVGAITLIPQHAAEALSLYVDTTSDSASLNACTGSANDCSLRGAIQKAIDDGGASSIGFSTSVFNTTQTITLGSDLPAITTNLTINGTGASLLTIAGNGHQVFDVGSSGNLTIRNMTISGGYSASYGGAAYVNGGAFAAYLVTFELQQLGRWRRRDLRQLRQQRDRERQHFPYQPRL